MESTKQGELELGADFEHAVARCRQYDWRFLRPGTHTGDPVSSHRAEAQTRASGRLGAHAALVLELVQSFDRRSSTELAAIAAEVSPGALARDDHVRLYQVRRRLSDLRALGLIDRVSSDRLPRESVWFAVEPPG